MNFEIQEINKCFQLSFKNEWTNEPMKILVYDWKNNTITQSWLDWLQHFIDDYSMVAFMCFFFLHLVTEPASCIIHWNITIVFFICSPECSIMNKEIMESNKNNKWMWPREEITQHAFPCRIYARRLPHKHGMLLNVLLTSREYQPERNNDRNPWVHFTVFSCPKKKTIIEKFNAQKIKSMSIYVYQVFFFLSEPLALFFFRLVS